MSSPHTDTANGLRFVARHGENVRFVAEDQSWFVWNGSYWEKDVLGQAMELAKDTAAGIYDEVRELATDGKQGEADERAKWAKSSLNVGKLRAMLTAASTDEDVRISASSLDGDTYLLNCTNGTVDLRTGELHEAPPGGPDHQVRLGRL